LSPRPLALELELELCLRPTISFALTPTPSLARVVVLCRPVPSSSPLAHLQTRRLPSRAHAALPPGILSLRVVVFVSGSWWSVVSRRRFPSSVAASRSTCRTRDPRDEDARRTGDGGRGTGLSDCSRGTRRGRLRVAAIFTVAGRGRVALEGSGRAAGEQRSVSSSSRAVSSSSSRSTDPRVTRLTSVFRLALSAYKAHHEAHAVSFTVAGGEYSALKD